jgi:hypothetical protein
VTGTTFLSKKDTYTLAKVWNNTDRTDSPEIASHEDNRVIQDLKFQYSLSEIFSPISNEFCGLYAK